MPEVYEVEVVTGEMATALSVPAAGLELEVQLESVSTVGQIPEPETIEVTILGTVQVPDGPVVYNEGGVPGIMKLGPLDPVPPGTPAGTVILRTE
jgi:hypothetical protein